MTRINKVGQTRSRGAGPLPPSMAWPRQNGLADSGGMGDTIGAEGHLGYPRRDRSRNGPPSIAGCREFYEPTASSHFLECDVPGRAPYCADGERTSLVQADVLRSRRI